ncbi:MAG TPA: NUDIX hydrolase [Hyphomicrobiaceae bacterium]|nr:NUDIX hydrolase [Hyphomicrobiaceae bacterium]
MPFPATPALTVDCVVVDRAKRVLLIRRRHPPFQGCLALPGGFVDIGETVEDACRRELFEETGLRVGRLTLVGVYSRPDRDPRGHTCSVAFLARARSTKVSAADDALAAQWVGDWRRTELAFDHRKIIADAMRLFQPRVGP